MASHSAQIQMYRNRLAVWGAFTLTLALGAAVLWAAPRIAPGQSPSHQKSLAPAAQKNAPPPRAQAGKEGVVQLTAPWERTYALTAGQTVEISVHLAQPSALPPNGRIAVEWTQTEAKGTDSALGWRKVLHALDHDVYLLYCAPATGQYRLRLYPVTDEPAIGEAGPRWREKGHVTSLAALPSKTPWPAGTVAPVAISVTPVAAGTEAEQEHLRTVIEREPNDTPETAQRIVLTPGKAEEVRTWEVTGIADELEYFDNGKVGQAGDDWFRLEYRGAEPRLLTAQISLPGQVLVARLRVYKGLPVVEYKDGQDPNERVHQQDEEHRANICRLLKPGETYFLRVEANAPGYQLQLRVLKPAPYADPRQAIRQGMYTQIGQVDAWLTNRPRGASIERRLRDSGNLLGTQCMSCHTQSGVWGPAVPLANGYRLENTQNYWHLINVMYECLRPTNELKDAANNTSLAPLDIGDGPAGTRAAGFNIVNLERVFQPRKLHASQQVRTANYILQTADPEGINAAGPGSNIGFVIVNTMATEILKTAWEKTGDQKYFRKMQEKARQVLAVEPKFTDDIALRLDYFHRVFPIQSIASWVKKASSREPIPNSEVLTAEFIAKVKAKLVEDETRLRAIQNPDGSWGFHPGVTPDGGKTWKPGEAGSDPSPTALGILGLTSAGHGKDDPAIAKAVQALLAMQEPTGRWNRAAQTGFVTTAYALHALSRLYPETPVPPRRADFTPEKNETLLQTVKRVQALALTGDPKFTDLLLEAARHRSPLVRYWALIGLGATNSEASVPALVKALSDRAKPVREAAIWAMRQTLLDDKGWEAVFTAYEKGDDTTRASVLQTLNMRADAVMPRAGLSWKRLTALLDRAMNRDPHPAARAWAAKAAWQWWVWNPPVRPALNAAWLTLLERPEPNALVENSNRYSSQALFIANGHKANGSGEHQYKELAELFRAITERLDNSKDAETKRRLARRLVAIGGTFYATAGGDGGPGQMGYVTEGAAEMMGKAALALLVPAIQSRDKRTAQAGLEGASGIPYQPLTAFLVDYSLKGPEDLRQLAASAVSDPRSVSLAAVPELVEPQLAQVRRGAMEPPRRPQVSDPIIDLWSRVNWIIPRTEEQQRAFFDLIIPKFDRYLSPEEIAALPDPAQRAEAEREMNAAWYLAERLGEVLQENPDLHQEIVFRRYFPTEFRNPLEERFWIRSAEWLLTFAPPAPPMDKKSARFDAERARMFVNPVFRRRSRTPNLPAQVRLAALPAQDRPTAKTQNPKPEPSDAPDETLTIKDRALQLYLDQLRPTANPRTREIAIRMANRTAFRTNPEVLKALSEALKFEQNKELRGLIENVLRQGTEKFLPDLMAALKQEKHASVRFEANGEPKPTSEQVEDIVYFRDYVMPELTRQKRSDQQSCIGCHGVEGRVPSLYLRPPDKFGYIPVKDLLFNYRTLQDRVNLSALEKSKILRKPLNVQDGTEDGHQGGRRYAPTDPGYLTLKRWVEAQPKVQKPE